MPVSLSRRGCCRTTRRHNSSTPEASVPQSSHSSGHTQLSPSPPIALFPFGFPTMNKYWSCTRALHWSLWKFSFENCQGHKYKSRPHSPERRLSQPPSRIQACLWALKVHFQVFSVASTGVPACGHNGCLTHLEAAWSNCSFLKEMRGSWPQMGLWPQNRVYIWRLYPSPGQFPEGGSRAGASKNRRELKAQVWEPRNRSNSTEGRPIRTIENGLNRMISKLTWLSVSSRRGWLHGFSHLQIRPFRSSWRLHETLQRDGRGYRLLSLGSAYSVSIISTVITNLMSIWWRLWLDKFIFPLYHVILFHCRPKRHSREIHTLHFLLHPQETGVLVVVRDGSYHKMVLTH